MAAIAGLLTPSTVHRRRLLFWRRSLEVDGEKTKRGRGGRWRCALLSRPQVGWHAATVADWRIRSCEAMYHRKAICCAGARNVLLALGPLHTKTLASEASEFGTAQRSLSPY